MKKFKIDMHSSIVRLCDPCHAYVFCFVSSFQMFFWSLSSHFSQCQWQACTYCLVSHLSYGAVQERKEREARATEDGWTVVVHHKGRKKTTDSESGITVGSVAPAVAESQLTKKKRKEVGPDFYRFQKREAQRSGMNLSPCILNYCAKN